MEYFRRIYRSFSNDIRHRKKVCLLYSIPACFALLLYYMGANAELFTFFLVPAAFRSLHLVIRPYVDDQNNRVYSLYPYIEYLGNACLTTSNTYTLGIWVAGVTTALDVIIQSNTMASSAIKIVIPELTKELLLSTLTDSNSPSPLLNLSNVIISIGSSLVITSLSNKLGINEFFPPFAFNIGMMLYDRFVHQADNKSIMVKHSIIALLAYSTSSSIKRYIEHPLLYATASTAETAFISCAEDMLAYYLLPTLHYNHMAHMTYIAFCMAYRPNSSYTPHASARMISYAPGT